MGLVLLLVSLLPLLSMSIKRREKAFIIFCLHNALLLSSISIPLLLSSLKVGDSVLKSIVFFDFFILPIVLFILFTYCNKLIQHTKALTFNANTLEQLEKLEMKDPRLLYLLFWAASLYGFFFV